VSGPNAPVGDSKPAKPVEVKPEEPLRDPELKTTPDSPSRAAPGVAAVPTVPVPAVERAAGAPSVASFPSEEAALAASRLKEEAALLRRARAELRAGALAQAFATLEASRRTFTAPELTQEREALAIELLYRSGERAAAASRARDFLARFPESPHAAAVRAFADDSGR
jgi:hypothetical protein